MKANLLFSLIIAIFLGYLCANFIFKQYATTPVFSEDNSVYILQYGAYEDKNNLDIDQNIKHIIVEDKKYYVYLGMTTEKTNALKIQEKYLEKNIELYIKEDNIYNNKFINELIQYDILLKNSKNMDEINSVLASILASYEENVLNGYNK